MPDGYTISAIYLRQLKGRVSVFFFTYDEKMNKKGYFVSSTDMKPFLSAEEWCYMNHLTDLKNLNGRIFNNDGIGAFSDSLLWRISSGLYNTALSGAVPAYGNDSLIRVEPLDLLKKIGAYFLNVPTKIGKDSGVIRPFSPLEVKGLVVVDESKMQGFASAFTTIGIGPTYIPQINGVKLPVQPMFYLRLDKSLLSTLPDIDIEYLKGLINFCRLHRIDPINYMDDSDSYDRGLEKE
jgi:hypothetical protein